MSDEAKPSPKAPPAPDEVLLNELESHLLGIVAVIRKVRLRKTLRNQDLPLKTDPPR